MASHRRHNKVYNPREDTKIYTLSSSRYLIAQLSHCCLDVPALSACVGGDQGIPGAANVQPAYAPPASADDIALCLLILSSRRLPSSR